MQSQKLRRKFLLVVKNRFPPDNQILCNIKDSFGARTASGHNYTSKTREKIYMQTSHMEK